MNLTVVGGTPRRSATLDAIVKNIQQERTDGGQELAISTRDEGIDVEAVLARLSGTKGFFTHVKILVEIGAFSGTFAAVFTLVCRGTRNAAVYVRILTYIGHRVQQVETLMAAKRQNSKIPTKIAAALNRLDLCDTFTEHSSGLNSVAKSMKDADIQAQIDDITKPNLLSLRTSPALREEFIGRTQVLLRTIAAHTPTPEMTEKTTELYRHCEALFIVVTSLNTGGIYADDRMTILGCGAFNSTFLFAASSDSKEVFKPLYEESLEARREDISYNTELGINLYNESNRNLGTCAVAKFVGHPELVVGTRLAVVNAQVGISMDLASGVSVLDAALGQGLDLRNNPNFQRQCTWLQLTDCITGNIDRHAANLNWDGKNERLTAFDNDMTFIDGSDRSFGDAVPESLYFSIDAGKRGERIGSADGRSRRNYCCPPVIDEEMREKILALQEKSLRDVLQSSGLTQRQIDAACKRLQCLKDQIQNPEKVTVISANGWGKDIPGKCHWYNTYFMSYTKTNSELNESAPSIDHAPRHGRTTARRDSF
ncbi:MAG: hypothetical protein LBF26_03485 [Puniceicoccales bacterium]|jgi:hypothetical protein|nr:hypothetical protein [Puniceicoccales bacterium]